MLFIAPEVCAYVMTISVKNYMYCTVIKRDSVLQYMIL